MVRRKQKKKKKLSKMPPPRRPRYIPSIQHWGLHGDRFDRLVDVVGLEGSRTRTESKLRRKKRKEKRCDVIDRGVRGIVELAVHS